MKATLLLEDGTCVHGLGHGAATERVGEVVFNTAMSGYEEVLSDPSYRGQIVLFTTSHLGNTGITLDDLESHGMEAEGLVCKELSEHADNHRARTSLPEFLAAQGRLALSGVDTRFLTQRLRTRGCMMGILSALEHSPEVLMRKLKSAARIEEQLLIASPKPSGSTLHPSPSSKARFKVAIVDCGIKRGILDAFDRLGCACYVFPVSVSVEEVMAIQPDGLFFSNGPGDPRTLAATTPVLSLIRTLAPRIPTFGICMGHQLIGLAFGGRIEKLPFGHHAVNHPVLEVNPTALAAAAQELGQGNRGRALITSQNHNYHVVAESVRSEFCITHTHLNDGSVAGMRHRQLPVFSVQFHPESNPGPQDAAGLFGNFVTMMEARRARS